MRRIWASLGRAIACAGLLACGGAAASDPPFANSVVSTDFDFILDSDPSALRSVAYVETGRREMPDKRSNELFAKAYIFKAVFEPQTESETVVEVWAHEDFGSPEAAEVYVTLLAEAIGRQPAVLRDALKHVVLHAGNETAFAEERAGFFVIYAENMDARVGTNDLQETVFHESAHVAWEREHATAEGWVAAQEADGGFITRYAAQNPAKEDIPESALFAFAVLNHPGRLPAEVEAAVREVMPHRLAYFEAIPGFVVEPADAGAESEPPQDP